MLVNMIIFQIMRKAIYSDIAGNLMRRTQMERLHIFPDAEIPTDIKASITGQIRPLRPVPKRLTEYSPEEVESFPKVFDFPNEYILR